MLPSLLARAIQTCLKQCLVSGFEPAVASMLGLMSRFSDDGAAELKGLYVLMGFPFVLGSVARTFFKSFQTEHPGYSHQEHTGKRLSSQHQGVSTLMATGADSGASSGKTECFLFQLVDHWLRACAAGELQSSVASALLAG